MTLEERRELYWQMYVAAVGIDTLMTPQEVRWALFDIPYGICTMLEYIGGYHRKYFLEERYLPELISLEPEIHGAFWFPSADWNIRSEVLLKAYYMTYESNI